MRGMPLLVASSEYAEIRLSELTMMAATLSSSTSFFSAACAFAGSPPSSSAKTFTGCPLTPPNCSLTYRSQAGPTVWPWFDDDACDPVNEPMTPTLIGEPVGAGAELAAA